MSTKSKSPISTDTRSKNTCFGQASTDRLVWLDSSYSFVMPQNDSFSPFWDSKELDSFYKKYDVISIDYSLYQSLLNPFSEEKTNFFISKSTFPHKLPCQSWQSFFPLFTGQTIRLNSLSPPEKDFLLAILLSLEQSKRLPLSFQDTFARFLFPPSQNSPIPPEYLPESRLKSSFGILSNVPLSISSPLLSFPPSISGYSSNTFYFPFPSSTIPPFSKTTSIFIFHKPPCSESFSLCIVDPGSYHSSFLSVFQFFSSFVNEISILLTHHHRDHIEGIFTCTGTDFPISEPKTKIKLFAHPKTLAHLNLMQISPPLTSHFQLRNAYDLIITNWKVISTPGHTDGHICFCSPKAGIFVVGDHFVGGSGSSSLDFSAGGKVEDFLQSCKLLEKISLTSNPKNLLAIPAHGPLVFDIPKKLKSISDHRLFRCFQVKDALASHKLHLITVQSELDEFVQTALSVLYPNIPNSLKIYATSNILLALEYLDAFDADFLSEVRSAFRKRKYQQYSKTLKFRDCFCA